MLPRESLNRFKKTVVFLGHINEQGQVVPNATGFLVEIKGLHLVTAKHVIHDCATNNLIDSEMFAFMSTIANSIRAIRIGDVKRMLKCDWIFHQYKEIDVAIIPFIPSPTDDRSYVPQDLFLSFEQIFELHDIFFISYQPGIQAVIQQRMASIIRTGSISVKMMMAHFILTRQPFQEIVTVRYF